jgi:hypothetical protein
MQENDIFNFNSITFRKMRGEDRLSLKVATDLRVLRYTQGSSPHRGIFTSILFKCKYWETYQDPDKLIAQFALP